MKSASPIVGRVNSILDRVLPKDRVRSVGLNFLWGILFLYPVLFAILNGRQTYSAYGGEVSPLQAPLSLVAHATVLACCALLLLRLGLPDVVRGRWSMRRAILVYLGAQFVVIVVHTSWDALPGWLVVFLVLLVVVAGYEPVDQVERRIRWWLRALILGSLVVMVVIPDWALVPPEHTSRTLIGTKLRLIGLTDSSNYIGLLACISFALEAGAKKRRVRFSALFAVAALVACTLSQSRIPLLAIALVVVVYLAHRFVPRAFNRPRISWLMGLSFAGALAVPIAVATSVFLNSQDSIERFTTGRLSIWVWTWQEFKQKPFFGQGHWVLTPEYWKTHLGRGYDQEPLPNAHNQVLETLVRGGLLEGLGLLLMVVALLVLVKQARLRPYGMTVLFLGVVTFSQFIFGTPFRTAGITWNLVQLAALVAIGVAAVRDEPVRPSGLTITDDVHETEESSA
ncbi:O-antigen ligase family protein [Nocardioides gilvus]|uniref:O-antigen ligase family protein n=1 Tax=Nocardioides gilvus TaxID=1735589 RepID=UPI000D74041D|nr:O-antigen ligase family protein [Nocardioides gilvus]